MQVIQERLENPISQTNWRDLVSQFVYLGFDVNYQACLGDCAQSNSPVEAFISELEALDLNLGVFLDALKNVDEGAAAKVAAIEISCADIKQEQGGVTRKAMQDACGEEMQHSVSDLQKKSITTLQECLEDDSRKLTWRNLASAFHLDLNYQRRLEETVRRSANITPIDILLQRLQQKGVSVGDLLQALKMMGHRQAARKVSEIEGTFWNTRQVC